MIPLMYLTLIFFATIGALSSFHYLQTLYIKALEEKVDKLK
jgi:hypothetical protein